MGYQLVLRAQGRRLRHDRRRDDEAARRHARDHQAALRRPALLGQAPAGGPLQAAGAEADPGALDRQPLGPDLAGAGRGGQPGPAVQGVDRPRRSSRAPRTSTSRWASPGCRRRSGSGRTSTRSRPASARKKNAHASAWHIDRAQDVRSLMSVEANQQWFGTAHHELGHIYYYLAYSRPEVPYLLREGRQPRVSRGDRRAGEAGQPADARTWEGRRACPRARSRTPPAGCCSRRSTRSSSSPGRRGR